MTRLTRARDRTEITRLPDTRPERSRGGVRFTLRPASARRGARLGVRPRRARGGDEEDRKCPEPDLNRHAREGAARFKLAVSAFHHPGVGARLRVCHRTLSGGFPRTAEQALDVVLFY